MAPITWEGAIMYMPPPDSEDHGKGDGPEDEAADIQMSPLWRASRTRRQDATR